MASKYKIGIVCSEFNFDLTQTMLEMAKEHAKFLDVDVSRVVMVPGVFDMPLAIKMLLKEKSIDGVVTIGAVIEGETAHDQIVIGQAARKITDLAVEFEKPVGLGITGPGMSRLQAEDRIERAKDAVESVVKQLKALK
ncbi:MAG: 6,7-dimethyl-8-ribityllumazine synthase [Thermoplasmata archaeon]|nr:6,7-dimethyl-8-ribityllumazine synthase [Thermoplasmata archaeon]TFG70404.1 MAG: 6,7-dimethyl-8-ribityllumazine synthase [Methanomassiliicoccus sp.]